MEPRLVDRRKLKCPFFGKECKKNWEDCALAVEKRRQYDDGTQVVIKACSMWATTDEMENHSQRLAMIQAEAGQTKQAAAFQALTLLTDGNPVYKRELAKVVRRAFPTPIKEDKQLEQGE